MSEYFHDVDTLAFQHQIDSISVEMKFRLQELIQACRAELSIFDDSLTTGKEPERAKETVVFYRFSSFLAILQTFRDALYKALGEEVDLSSLSQGVPHSELLFQLRNALVHDGYQPVSLWVDGRYYLPVGFKRPGQGKKIVRVSAPSVDIETLVLEYASVYCEHLAFLLEALPVDSKFSGPRRSYEWFKEAWEHPALLKIQGLASPSYAEWSVHNVVDQVPLDMAVYKLRDISKMCAERLEELKDLPEVPFPDGS